MQRFLGIALLIGGLLVGLIVLWLMWLYANEELLATGTAVTGALAGLLILALPQFILGVYLLRANW